MSEKYFIGTKEANDIAEFLNKLEQKTGKKVCKTDIQCDASDCSNRTLHVSMEFDPNYDD